MVGANIRIETLISMDLSQKGAPKQENVLCLGQANMDSLVSMFKVRARVVPAVFCSSGFSWVL